MGFGEFLNGSGALEKTKEPNKEPSDNFRWILIVDDFVESLQEKNVAIVDTIET